MDKDGFYYCDTPGCKYKCKNKGSVKTHIKKVKHLARNYIPKVSVTEDEEIINCAVKIDSDGKYVCGYNSKCSHIYDNFHLSINPLQAFSIQYSIGRYFF